MLCGGLAGARHTQRACTPLWRMVVVHGNPGRTARLLDSEEAVLAAEVADGSHLPGVRTWRRGLPH